MWAGPRGATQHLLRARGVTTIHHHLRHVAPHCVGVALHVQREPRRLGHFPAVVQRESSGDGAEGEDDSPNVVRLGRDGGLDLRRVQRFVFSGRCLPGLTSRDGGGEGWGGVGGLEAGCDEGGGGGGGEDPEPLHGENRRDVGAAGAGGGIFWKMGVGVGMGVFVYIGGSGVNLLVVPIGR